MLCSVASISFPMRCLVSAFAECSQQGLTRGPLQIVSGTRPLRWASLRWRRLQFLRLHHDGGVEHGRVAQAFWSKYMTLGVLGKKCKIWTTNVLTAPLHA